MPIEDAETLAGLFVSSCSSVVMHSDLVRDAQNSTGYCSSMYSILAGRWEGYY